MTDNTDIVPALFELIGRDIANDTRTYRCRGCGELLPEVRDGEELRSVADSHLDENPACRGR